MCCAGIAKDDDYTPFVDELCALVSRLWIRGRRVQTHSKPSVRILLERMAAKGAAERRMEKSVAENWSLSSSASERSQK